MRSNTPSGSGNGTVVTIGGSTFTFDVETQGDTTFEIGEITSVRLGDLWSFLAETLKIHELPDLPLDILVERLALEVVTGKGAATAAEYHFEASVDFAPEGSPVRLEKLFLQSGPGSVAIQAEISLAKETGEALMGCFGELRKSESGWALTANWAALGRNVAPEDLLHSFGM